MHAPRVGARRPDASRGGPGRCRRRYRVRSAPGTGRPVPSGKPEDRIDVPVDVVEIAPVAAAVAVADAEVAVAMEMARRLARLVRRRFRLDRRARGDGLIKGEMARVHDSAPWGTAQCQRAPGRSGKARAMGHATFGTDGPRRAPGACAEATTTAPKRRKSPRR